MCFQPVAHEKIAIHDTTINFRESRDLTMKSHNVPFEHLTRLRRIRGLARLMDTALRLPGTRVSLGADSILGLIPGIGDFAGAAISLFIINEARRYQS